MPANIFYSIVNADLGNLLNGKLILLACVLQVVISMISVGIALVSRKKKDPDRVLWPMGSCMGISSSSVH